MCTDYIVTYLPGAKIMDIMYGSDRLVDSAGDEPVFMVHVSINDAVKCSHMVVEENFKLLDRRLKARISKTAFYPFHSTHTGPLRQTQIGSLNAWMRWLCRKEVFKFVRYWDFWNKQSLYKRDSLHLSWERTRLWLKKMCLSLKSAPNPHLLKKEGIQKNTDRSA